MAARYKIELTQRAKSVYTRLYEEAQKCIDTGDPSNSKVTHFRMVEELLDKIIPHDPSNPDRALTGNLANMFRVKKGRIRIAYVGSSTKQKIVVLYISETPRKEGHLDDPYAILTKLVWSGKFDSIFDVLGIKKPDRKRFSDSIMIQ